MAAANPVHRQIANLRKKLKKAYPAKKPAARKVVTRKAARRLMRRAA
jgi:hypothetical protein